MHINEWTMELAPVNNSQVKKRKRVPVPNLQVTECVREFNLTQAYPSMANAMKKSPVNMTVERVHLPPTINLKIKSGKIDTTNKLQKLKLKSPDGRDLGEFDVQVLPQAATTPVIQAKTGPTISSVKYLGKPIPQVVPGDQASTHGVLIPISPVILNSNKYTEQVPVSDETPENSQAYVVPGNAVHQMNVASKEGVERIPFNSNMQGFQSLNLRNGQPIPAGMKIKVINGRSLHAKGGVSGILTGDKITAIKRRPSDRSTISRIEPNKVIKLENMPTTDLAANSYYVLPDQATVKAIPSGYELVQGNRGAEQMQHHPRNSLGRINLLRREKKDAITSMNVNVSPKIECDSTINSIVGGDSTKDNFANANDRNPLEDDTSDLSAVGEALRSLPDEELRNKALEALRSVGIGLERLIPKKQVEHIAIKDSESQTEVFGLLSNNKDEFIKASEDAPSLERLSLSERRLNDPAPMARPERTEQTFNGRQLDSLLLKLVDDEKVQQVRNIMKFHPATERLYNLLERDFRTVGEYDKYGLLGIHRAVLDQSVRGVKRQLLIMKACKVDVDISAKDGSTSLEAAIRFSAPQEIISLLLRAGANPASSRTAHDSALTIASHRTLPILPQLIKRVRKSGDLNNLDSNGFAAIHYCAQNGNYDGVIALIEADADLNVRDSKSGRTALFHAIENEELKIANELLMNGAKPNIPIFSGQTCYHIYDDTKHGPLKDILGKAPK